EGAQVGIWDWDLTSGVIEFNQRWMTLFGLGSRAFVGQLDYMMKRIHPDDFSACFNTINAHLDGHTEFYEHVQRMRHSDGRWLYMLDRGRVTERDENGKPVKFTSTLTDITVQKEAELEARRAAQAKNLFLANISHEIRTPLHGILGITEVLEKTT